MDDLKKMRSEKFKLKNEIKNLLRKKNESQRNILYLKFEIEETQKRIKNLEDQASGIEKRLKSNLKTFIASFIREKNNDLNFSSKVEEQVYKNWRRQAMQIQNIKKEMQLGLEGMLESKEELKEFIDSSKSLTFRIEKEIQDLNEKQVRLRYRALSEGPDSVFYQMEGRMYWPVANARLVGSRGFYKVSGENVFNYNEGMKFKTTGRTPVYPIYRGEIEEMLDIDELGSLIVVRHTENIRSFYIGAEPYPGLKKGINISPDQQIGLVKDGELELKLRFDTESLDPTQWVVRRR